MIKRNAGLLGALVFTAFVTILWLVILEVQNYNEAQAAKNHSLCVNVARERYDIWWTDDITAEVVYSATGDSKYIICFSSEGGHFVIYPDGSTPVGW